MQDCKVNILGTEWNIIFQTIEQDKAFADCDGYCDPTVKKIHVRLYTDEEVKDNKFAYESREEHRKKVIRHEILHAFMFESGLWRNSFSVDLSWSMNEEMIDFYAIQSPKIFKVFQELDII